MTARLLKNQSGYTDKQAVRVLTVDKGRRRVECALREGAVVYAAVWEIPTVFRWPKTGEIWTIRRDSGVWRLDALVEDRNHIEEAGTLDDVEEGEARILVESSERGSGLIINRFHAARVASFNLGNGTDTTYTVTHNLKTKDVAVSIRDKTTNVYVGADVTTIDKNSLEIEFSEIPDEDQYRVTLIG